MKTQVDPRVDQEEAPRPLVRQPAIWSSAFRLARGALVGLAISLLLNVTLGALCVALSFRPADVIVVDQLGTATFIPKAEAHPEASEFEAQEFARNWTAKFLSQDGMTGQADFAQALSLVHPSLQPELKRRFIDSGLLERITSAFAECKVTVEDARIDQESSGRLLAHVAGKRTLVAIGADKHTAATEPFSLQLVLQRTKRTKDAPNALIVRYIASTSHGESYEAGNKK